MENAKEAAGRLLHALTHFRLGKGMAEVELPGCEVHLAVIGRTESGGRVINHADFDPVYRDLVAVLRPHLCGCPDPDEEDGLCGFCLLDPVPSDDCDCDDCDCDDCDCDDCDCDDCDDCDCAGGVPS